jgi:hypothetical protein
LRATNLAVLDETQCVAPEQLRNKYKKPAILH